MQSESRTASVPRCTAGGFAMDHQGQVTMGAAQPLWCWRVRTFACCLTEDAPFRSHISGIQPDAFPSEVMSLLPITAEVCFVHQLSQLPQQGSSACMLTWPMDDKLRMAGMEGDLFGTDEVKYSCPKGEDTIQ